MPTTLFSQFDTHYGSRLISCGASLLALTTVSVALRFYTRLSIHKFGADDWFLLIAQILFIVHTSQVIWNGAVALSDRPILSKIPDFGVGRAGQALTDQTIYSIPVSGLFSQIFVKLALAAFFLRIVLRPLLRALIILTVIYFTLVETVFIFLTLFKCGNPNWQKGFQGYALPGCISKQSVDDMTWVVNVSNSLTDWILLACPIYIIATTGGLKLFEKLSASALIAVGTLGSLVAVIRLPYTYMIINAPPSSQDLLNSAVAIAVIGVVESGLGIIVLSLAALRPLAVRLGRRLGWIAREPDPVVDEILPAVDCESMDDEKRAVSLPATGDANGTKRDSLFFREVPTQADIEGGERPSG